MRPRELLRFLRQCVNVAVNRGHTKVSEGDILQAEKTYSEDQLQEVSFELRDVSPQYPDILYAFIGSPETISEESVYQKLQEAGVAKEDGDRVFELLVWFGFLGIIARDGEDRYAYEYQYGVKRMMLDAIPPKRFVVHPAFRTALGCTA